MRRMRIPLLLIILFSTASVLPAVEGLFQINSVYQSGTYPLFGSGGKDKIKHSSAGIALKSSRGEGLQGVVDLAILFPYKLEEMMYPADEYSSRSLDARPVGLDGVVGIGYLFDLDPMAVFFSGGFHTGALFDGGDYLAAFGIGLDLQTFVRLGKIMTAQMGLKFSLDFGGVQTFVSGSNEFAGLPSSLGMYTGIGLNY